VADSGPVVAAALTTGSPDLYVFNTATELDVSGSVLSLDGDQFINLVAGSTQVVATDSVVIDGDVGFDLGILDTFGGDTAAGITFGGAANGSYTVDMGSSEAQSITLKGTGDHQITAGTGVQEEFMMEATANGGSTLNALEVDDLVDISKSGAVVLTDNVLPGQVNAVGEWSFDGAVLTWFDTAAPESVTLQLSGGATDIQLEPDNHTFRVI
jgi:hypothetical protein